MPDPWSFPPETWRGILEEQPRWAWLARQGMWGQAPQQRRTLLNQFDDIYDVFLGQLGQQLQQGQMPTLNFDPWLSQRFPTAQTFTSFFQGLPPSQRGVSPGRFAPQTRFVGF